jgi:hypothetical protein
MPNPNHWSDVGRALTGKKAKPLSNWPLYETRQTNLSLEKLKVVSPAGARLSGSIGAGQ